MRDVIKDLVCRDSVVLSQWLSEQAMQGELRGLAVVAHWRGDSEEMLFTGTFRARRRLAIAAAVDLFHAACEVTDEAPPHPSRTSRRGMR
jgi:hypothetical protein